MEEAKDLDMIVMDIIVHSGNARSLAIEALREARQGHFESAESKLAECEAELTEAHHVQTELLVGETNGQAIPVSLIMVHAQDHLMNAMTVKDLTKELIVILKEKE